MYEAARDGDAARLVALLTQEGGPAPTDYQDPQARRRTDTQLTPTDGTPVHTSTSIAQQHSTTTAQPSHTRADRVHPAPPGGGRRGGGVRGAAAGVRRAPGRPQPRGADPPRPPLRHPAAAPHFPLPRFCNFPLLFRRPWLSPLRPSGASRSPPDTQRTPPPTDRRDPPPLRRGVPPRPLRRGAPRPPALRRPKRPQPLGPVPTPRCCHTLGRGGGRGHADGGRARRRRGGRPRRRRGRVDPPVRVCHAPCPESPPKPLPGSSPPPIVAAPLSVHPRHRRRRTHAHPRPPPAGTARRSTATRGAARSCWRSARTPAPRRRRACRRWRRRRRTGGSARRRWRS